MPAVLERPDGFGVQGVCPAQRLAVPGVIRGDLAFAADLSMAASAWVLLCVSAPITIMQRVLSNRGVSFDWTVGGHGFSGGGCHAPIKSRR